MNAVKSMAKRSLDNQRLVTVKSCGLKNGCA